MTPKTLFKFLPLSFAVVSLVACEARQELGNNGGALGANDDNDAGGAVVAESDAGKPADPATNGKDGGKTTASDAGKDVSTGDLVHVACPSAVGYPAAEGISFKVVGGGFAGTFAIGPSASSSASLSSGVLGLGPVAPGTTPRYGAAGRQPQSSAFFATSETSDEVVPGAYPIDAYFDLNPPGLVKDARNYVKDPSGIELYRYPAGAGSCTMVVDVSRKPGLISLPPGVDDGCLRARFSCTGLVGKDSGESFDVVDGLIVVGE